MPTFFNLVTELQSLIDSLEVIISGGNDQIVTVNGVQKDSLSKAINDKFYTIRSIANGSLPYETKAALDNAGEPETPSMGFVWGENDTLNGAYGWNGTEWVKSEYDPLSYTFLSESSVSSKNAGFKHIPVNKYHSYGGVVISADAKNSHVMTITKSVTTEDAIWYGAWIEINYNSLNELDLQLMLELEQTEGTSFNSLKIVARKESWHATNYPIDVNANETSLNLYEKISNSTQDNIDYYTAANKLYLVVGSYNPIPADNNASTATWKVSARFTGDYLVIASDVTEDLRTSLTKTDEEIKDVVESNIALPYGVSKIRIPSDISNSNAIINKLYTDANENVHTIDATVNTEVNSYSYIAFEISTDIAEFINKRYRVYIESSNDSVLSVFATNGAAWGSADNSIGSFINVGFTPLEDDNYSGYVDLDILNSDAVNFYAESQRSGHQNLHCIVGLSVASISDVSFRVSIIDLDEYESILTKTINPSSPYFLPVDSLPKKVTGLEIQTNELEESVKYWGKKSNPVPTSTNAGVSFIDDSDVYAVADRAIIATGEISNGGLVFTKVSETASYTYYLVKIAIHYETIEDLNRTLQLRYSLKSGVEASTFNFTIGEQGPWSPNYYPVSLTNPEGGYNLYEVLMQQDSSLRAVYEERNVLYINVAAYNSDDSILPGAESQWELDPYFEIPNTLVVANKLTEELEASLNQKIEDASNVLEYITCWGDSLTAGGGWTTQIESLSGLTVYNAGTGGEDCRSISARQGADVMIINNITIPSDTSQVIIADRDIDGGISTEMGHKCTPLLQGGNHINPCLIGGIEGTLSWTGTDHSDMTGNWVFSRNEAGSELEINRPTAIRTNFDINYNSGITIVFIGQNGGYDDVDDLVLQNRRIIEHAESSKYLVLGLSSWTAAGRADYEEAMRKEFGRYFVSLREYLSSPIYDVDGTTIINCYGLDDAGLTATQDDLDAIKTGAVPPQCLIDTVHYTAETKTVIGSMLYKKMVELNIL